MQPQTSPSSTKISGTDCGNLRLVPYANPDRPYWVGRNDSFSCYSADTSYSHTQGSGEVPKTRPEKLWDKSFDTGFDCWAVDPALGVLVVFDFLLHRCVTLANVSLSILSSAL